MRASHGTCLSRVHLRDRAIGFIHHPARLTSGVGAERFNSLHVSWSALVPDVSRRTDPGDDRRCLNLHLPGFKTNEPSNLKVLKDPAYIPAVLPTELRFWTSLPSPSTKIAAGSVPKQRAYGHHVRRQWRIISLTTSNSSSTTKTVCQAWNAVVYSRTEYSSYSVNKLLREHSSKLLKPPKYVDANSATTPRRRAFTHYKSVSSDIFTQNI